MRSFETNSFIANIIATTTDILKDETDKQIMEMCNPSDETDSDKEIIEKLNKIVQMPDVKKTPILRMKHISHLDLDGYGATILSEILQSFYPDDAMTLETRNILPNRLINEINETIENIDNYDLVVITDLAINQQIIDLINNCKKGNIFRVFDHHICKAENVPDNFVITINSPIHKNKLTCATELYYNFIKNDRVYGLIYNDDIRKAIAYFVECVRIYDTFEFWATRNDDDNEIDMMYKDAPRLNTLFHIMEREDFKQYIYHYINNANSSSWILLTHSSTAYPWISKILELENNKNTKYVESALRRMVRTPFNYSIYKDGKIYDLDYLVGVIFAEKSSPVIANTALERNDDIDFCAVVSNNQVSIYTNRPNVDAFEIAKIFGGGGHKEAAGFTIPYSSATVFNMEHFNKIIECAASIEPNTTTFPEIDVSDTN